MSNHVDSGKVLDANIKYHSVLADDYDATQPHFKSENVQRVEQILARMAEQNGGGSLLDVGCGTGFIINIAKKYFDRVVGVDATQAMLDRVDTSGGNVELHLADTSDIPLPDGEFDACTAYSFLHHLYDLRPTLAEAFRCLRFGGRFYSDQDPNYHFWQLMMTIRDRGDLPASVDREVKSVVNISDDIASEKPISSDDISMAEYQKVMKGGFDVDLVTQVIRDVGFQSIEPRYEWFLAQGKVLHQQSADDVETIETFLRSSLPATRHLFKYVAFHAVKE